MSERYGDRYHCICSTRDGEALFEINDMKTGQWVEVSAVAWREMVENHAAYFKDRSAEDTHWGPTKEYADA